MQGFLHFAGHAGTWFFYNTVFHEDKPGPLPLCEAGSTVCSFEKFMLKWEELNTGLIKGVGRSPKQKLDRKEELLAEYTNLNKHEGENMRPRGNLGQMKEGARWGVLVYMHIHLTWRWSIGVMQSQLKALRGLS